MKIEMASVARHRKSSIAPPPAGGAGGNRAGEGIAESRMEIGRIPLSVRAGPPGF